MQAYVVVGVIICGIGGFSLAAAVVLKHFFEHTMLKYFALVCYQRILTEEDMSWDKLSNLYKSEMEKIIGIPGVLTPPEGHELVVLLDKLCEKHQPPVRWGPLIRNFDESIPGAYYPGDGFGRFVMVAFGMILLLSMVGFLSIMLGRTGAALKVSQAGVPTLIFFSISMVRLRWFLQVRKALLNKSLAS